jgi:hypothetical protein
VWRERGLELDPDLAVRRAIGTIFERFAIEPTAHAVVRWARREGFRVSTRRSFADGTGELSWKPLGISRLKEILKSPIYAGAYAYGRRSEQKILVDGEINTVRRSKAPDEWVALIQGAHEGYLSWESYLSNRDKMHQNSARRPSPGAPREGRALLTGRVVRAQRNSRRPVPLVESAPLDNGERLVAFEPGELLFFSGCSWCRAATGDAGSPLFMSALPNWLADGVADDPAVRVTWIGSGQAR